MARLHRPERYSEYIPVQYVIEDFQPGLPPRARLEQQIAMGRRVSPHLRREGAGGARANSTQLKTCRVHMLPVCACVHRARISAAGRLEYMVHLPSTALYLLKERYMGALHIAHITSHTHAAAD